MGFIFSKMKNKNYLIRGSFLIYFFTSYEIYHAPEIIHSFFMGITCESCNYFLKSCNTILHKGHHLRYS